MKIEISKKCHVIWQEMEISNIFRRKNNNLDDPDGSQHFCHILKKGPKQYFTLQIREGSVMVWGAWCLGSWWIMLFNPNIVTYEFCIKSGYVIWPFLGGANRMDQKENSFWHVYKSTQQWFKKEKKSVFLFFISKSKSMLESHGKSLGRLKSQSLWW